ncbi:MAG: hypothetical protein ACJ74U_07210 [Jatrophihabitantaceae bacterium]
MLAGLAAIAIRLPLLGVPLDADEGGYAYLARRWAGGSRLYGAAWVDRPQALLVGYRLVTDLGRSRIWIHLAAIGLALLLLAAVASAGWALAGRRAAVFGAFLVAIVGAAPHLQGFMFNGELAAGAFSASAVAGAAWYLRRGNGWLLVLAGGFGAIALLMKQSGFDGLLTALVCAVAVGQDGVAERATVAERDRLAEPATVAERDTVPERDTLPERDTVPERDTLPRRDRDGRAASRIPLTGRSRAVAAVLLGAAGPLGLAALHAALTSWRDWWFAVVGYRLHTSAGSRGGLSGRWHNLTAGLPRLWPDLLPLGVLGLAGLALCLVRRGWAPASRPAAASPSRRWSPAGWLPVSWLVLAFLGFFGGVFFFPHYWMQLVGPLCLLGALALAALPPRAATCLLVVACLPCLLWTARASVASPDRRDRLAVPDPRLLANRDIGPWLRQHAAADDQLYAFVSAADLYYSTGLHTDFRYLWQANLEAIPGALGELRDYLAGPDRPRWVVLYQHPSAIDPTGAIGRTLATDYRTVTVIDGYPILHVR